MPSTDSFSKALATKAPYLLVMIVIRMLPSFGLLTSGRNNAGALGGIFGGFLSVVVVFFLFAVIFRFVHRGGRLNWHQSCNRATWVTFVCFLIECAGDRLRK